MPQTVQSLQIMQLNVLCLLLKQQAAPDVEIDAFDGNPLNYSYFMTLFKETVERKINDPKGWLTRLIKFTRVEAKNQSKTASSCQSRPYPWWRGDTTIHIPLLQPTEGELKRWSVIRPGIQLPWKILQPLDKMPEHQCWYYLFY